MIGNLTKSGIEIIIADLIFKYSKVGFNKIKKKFCIRYKSPIGTFYIEKKIYVIQDQIIIFPRFLGNKLLELNIIDQINNKIEDGKSVDINYIGKSNENQETVINYIFSNIYNNKNKINGFCGLTLQLQAGTGKTFSILQIAFLHAQEYQKVLICCFNKVLASDIRRILNLQEIINKDNEFYKSIKENIEVLDIYSLITRLNDDFYDKPFDLALETELINNLEKENLNNYPKFDTLLIDESQDFKLDHFRFLKIVSSANSHLVFSNGKGQEIYQNRDFSENKIENIFEQKASHLSLRKNYRNVKAIFDLSNIFFECKIDEASIGKYFEKYQNYLLEKE